VSFTQTSSIVRRFRTLTVLLGLFVLLEFVGIFVSSQTSLDGLRKLNRANTFTELAARGIANLDSAIEAIDKKQAESVYDLAEKEVITSVNTVIEMHPASPKVYGMFTDAQKSVLELDKVAKDIFILRQQPSTRENLALISKDLLLAKQFELDINDSLRGAQIELTQIANRIFNDLYQGRWTPIAISFGIALLFFVAALWIGFYTTKRLSISLGHLLKATDEVARGNLKIKVPILDHDEIGRLSSAFDEMVKNLEVSLKKEKTAAERVFRLQDITAEFSRALDPAAVGSAVVLHGNAELESSGGFVAIISDDRESLEMLGFAGYDPAIIDDWKQIPITLKVPSALSALHRNLFFCETEAEVRAQFENPALLAEFPKALACVPLVANETSIGSLTFTFDHEKRFSSEERDFVIALADLASQALQRAQLYNDAQEAIQVREEFLSIASHELKTPITSLKMQLQLAQMQTKPAENLAPSPQKLARMFEVSVNQVNRLTSLVDDLLDVSRFEAGKLSFHFAFFDLSTILKEVLERFESVLNHSHSPAEILQMDSVQLYADVFRIEQVIVNLLSNAMKYGAGKPIQITLVKKETTVELSIRDHGIGIPADKHALIFGRFERAANTQNIGGLGLGLYIAKQIVEAHQGEILVESEPNVGSCFKVILPLKFSPGAA
jgi:signal transduction histidine kinase/HAMP domain-containing protein